MLHNEPVDSEVKQSAPVESPDPAELLPAPNSENQVDAVLSTARNPRGVAPAWHTLVLVLGILAFSIWGAVRPDSATINPLAPVQKGAHASASAASNGSDPVRLIRYALTGALELVVVAWVALGLRLRKVPFRSLFGAWPTGLNDITREAGIAALFWICSMVVLGSVALSWQVVQTQIEKHHAASESTKAGAHNSGSVRKTGEQQQVDLARQLMELAPANGIEMSAWAFLCLIVGFSEELTFRGYLQSQNIALLHRIPVAVVVTAIIFGAAHGYQGIRGIVLISVYGVLFSSITLLRKNLFPGMLAHSWHDFATGMALAAIRSLHLLDHLPNAK
jgi:membrane protease YdiL (CAAX protease family)